MMPPRLLFLLFVIVCNCASGGEAVRKTAATAVQFADTTYPIFVRWDLEHQQKLVAEHIGDGAAQRQALDAYRVKRAEVMKLFRTVKQMGVTAEPLAGLIDTKVKGSKDAGEYLQHVLDLLNKLTELLGDLGFDLIGGK